MKRFVKGFLDLLTVKFLTGFGQNPQHLFGTLGLGAFAMGSLGMLYLTVLWLYRQAFCSVEELAALAPLHQRPLLLFSAVAFLFGSQILCTGLLAEMLTSYQGRDSDAFSIAEETGSGSGQRPEVS
jgi:dolichol-phosphate mannosyltransferase